MQVFCTFESETYVSSFSGGRIQILIFKKGLETYKI